MSSEIKKAIIPAGGLGTRFLPLTKVISKELLPLVDYPMISYTVREAKNSGIEQVVFVTAPLNNKQLMNYFKKTPKLEAVLKKRDQKDRLETLQKATQEFEGLTFSSVIQPSPKGDGDAILKAKKQIGKDPFGVLFHDDIFASRTPPLAQLKKVFAASQKIVVGLKRVSKEKVSAYGTMEIEKIANRLYKIKGIVEKPPLEKAPSDLVFCGRCVLTPEIFDYLEKTPPTKKGEIILVEAWNKMLEDGKIVYGYELEGEWLECGNISDWIRSNLYLCLQHPKYGPTLRDYFKKIK